MSHCFHGATDKPNMISQQNSKLGSAQKTEVLTSTSGPQRHHCSGWSKWSHVAHCQSALCFFLAGAIAEPKVKSSSGGTFWQLFQGWLWVMWTWTFPVSFTTMDFVFCKSGVALFLHHQDTMSYWNLVSRILCPIRCSKNVHHCSGSVDGDSSHGFDCSELAANVQSISMLT